MIPPTVVFIWLALSGAAAQTPIDHARAEVYFAEAAAMCAREGSRLWGVSLCGPMVFADGPTRSIATNQAVPAGPRPPVLGVVNAPVEWGGARWSAYVWSTIPTDAQARRRLIVHELFHRVQPELGLLVVGAPNNQAH